MVGKELKISSKAFWDVSFEKLMQQRDNYQEFIIKRVFEFGSFQDILTVYKYFGRQKIIDVLTNITYLPLKKIHFASVFLNIEKNNFKCYTNKRHRPSFIKH